MADTTVLMLADPHQPQLRLMDALKSDIDIIVGKRADVFEKFAARADVILSWSGSVSYSAKYSTSAPTCSGYILALRALREYSPLNS